MAEQWTDYAVPALMEAPDTKVQKIASRARTVTILAEDNFNIWKWNLKYNLKSLGLYECITKKEEDRESSRSDEAVSAR